MPELTRRGLSRTVRNRIRCAGRGTSNAPLEADPDRGLRGPLRSLMTPNICALRTARGGFKSQERPGFHRHRRRSRPTGLESVLEAPSQPEMKPDRDRPTGILGPQTRVWMGRELPKMTIPRSPRREPRIRRSWLVNSMAQFPSFCAPCGYSKNWRLLRADFGTHPGLPRRSNGLPHFGSSCLSPRLRMLSP